MSAVRRAIAIAKDACQSDMARRFLVATVASFVVSVGSAGLFHDILGVAEQLGAAIALAVALVFNFFSMRLYVFRSKGHILREAAEFALSSIGFRVAEYICFLLLFELVALPYLVAFVAALGLSFVAKYFFHKKITFREKH